jgi:NOL1/NOP2/fmu family ribosome biogenesis protein
MLSKEEALSYLHKQNFNLNFENIGIHVLKYNNIPLGLANNIGKRWNNMLPNSFKIKKL